MDTNYSALRLINRKILSASIALIGGSVTVTTKWDRNDEVYKTTAYVSCDGMVNGKAYLYETTTLPHMGVWNQNKIEAMWRQKGKVEKWMVKLFLCTD